MQYCKTVMTKKGVACLLRSATAADASDMVRLFNQTHEETDFLLTYPDETTHMAEKEAEFLGNTEKSENAIEIFAVVDGQPVGTAGIQPIGSKYKVRHRADFGISVLKAYWGRGIGRALTEACIECARSAGYRQLELEAVAANETALSLYRSCGFVEYGRNPLGFRSRVSGWQEVVLMRLDLAPEE